MNCKSFHDELESCDARLPLNHAAHAHAARCPSCARARGERLALDRLLREVGGVAPPADFDVRLRSRLVHARAGASRTRLLSFDSQIALAGFAACCVVVILVALAFKAESENSAVYVAVTEHQSAIEKPIARSVDVLPPPSSSRTGTQSSTPNPQLKFHSANRNRPSIARATFADVRRGRTTRESSIETSTTNQDASTARVEISEATAADAPILRDRLQDRMEVRLRDSRGEKNAIMLEAVSFGGTPFADKTKLAARAADAEQGVW